LKRLSQIIPKPHGWLVGAVVLYLLSFLFIRSFSPERSIKNEVSRLQDYVREQQKEFNDLVSDTTLIKTLAYKTYTNKELDKYYKEPTGIFVYKKDFGGGELTFWSNQSSFPPNEIFSYPDTAYFEKRPNGYYICIKSTFGLTTKYDSIATIGMIPVMYVYFSSLEKRFVHSNTASEKIEIANLETEYVVTGETDNIKFYVSPLTTITPPIVELTLIFKLLAVLFLLIYIQFCAERITAQYGFWKALLFLAGALISFRVLSYFTLFPFNLRQFELFDPKVYGSNPIHKSLGDLLINSAFFCWLVLFSWQKIRATGFYDLSFKKGIVKGIIGSLMVVIVTFLIAYIIRTLAADSSISFDVINVFSITQFTAFGIITLSILAVGYYYFMKIMTPLLQLSFNNIFPVYLIVAAAGLSFLTFEVDNPLLGFYIIVLAWLIFYIWLSGIKKFGINKQRQTMAGGLFWIFIFSVSITAVIIDANREKEWQSRIGIAERINRQTDPYNEQELSITLTFIDNDFLSPNFYRFSKDQASAVLLRDSLLRTDYVRDFNSRLYVFDAKKKPLYNEQQEDYNTLETIIDIQATKTAFPDLYFFTNKDNKYTFIYKQTVTDSSGIIGYVFLLSDPGSDNDMELEAQLFKGSTRDIFSTLQNYSYGIYLNDTLNSVSAYNKYPFHTLLKPSDRPKETVEKRLANGHSELWYKAKNFANNVTVVEKGGKLIFAARNDKVIVVARKKADMLEAITLFSYIFCVFLFLVGLFNALVLLLRIGGDLKEFRRIIEWNIRTQIHSTIIFVSILSFIIIGISTISFFIVRYRQNNEERLSRTMDVTTTQMQKKLDERHVFDDKLPIYDSASNQEVIKVVNEIADVHNVDVNVYDTTGRLYVTSQPLVYREGFLSKQLDPLGFYHLNHLREVQHVQEEKLASTKYMSIYAPLRSKDGKTYAYINIPYFLSQQELKQEISNFLVTIINLNAFIFLVSGVIALFITNRVTRSFSLISDKMREINLGKTNEEIEWSRNDEIGGLVREYNKMVNKLEVSAQALARSEREGAWREMARQVAHEIKNPLTPMKLSIQFLQKSIDNNSANVKELTAQVAKTLVEQIDHLSKIAFDFSQFANIGNTNVEVFDINEVIRSLDNLYKASDESDLRLNAIEGKVLIKADKTQMNRLFTNLIQNAIEACDGKDKCKIELGELRVDGVVQISVKDNGEGIPKEMQSKIFVPNFTTKSSGTGLGLAMCKGIAEQAGGRIWFETEKGVGSTFFVELPVVN
jgi:two-component system, NtrC family, nitrogen regulation sensor histidine kinase NtrY